MNPILSKGELKELVNNKWNTAKNVYINDINDIKSIARMESDIIKEEYKGRYLFELIQNARDASLYEKNGKIKILLKDKKLYVVNSGKPFNKDGLESLCYLAFSTKEDKNFIGHKGIGFVSVLEVAKKVEIVTEFGTVFFSKEKTLEKLSNKNLKENDIPFFRFPYYDPKTIQNLGYNLDKYTTTIILHLKENIKEEEIYKNFEENINEESVLFLGNLEQISFESENYKDTLLITTYEKQVNIIRERNNNISEKNYLLLKKFFSLEEFDKNLFEEEERKTFKNEKEVESQIAILKEGKTLKPIPKAKLYLFYPLESISGFKFLIHSFFTANAGRTQIGKTKFNEFLQKKIAHFIAEEILEELKKEYPNDLLSILPYDEEYNSGLTVLYQELKSLLKDKKFILIDNSFYSPAEILIAKKEEIDLFGTNFGNYKLLLDDETELIDWLKSFFNVEELSDNYIKEDIEKICEDRKSDFDFFSKLYNYLRKKEDYYYKTLKILLTEDQKLVSGDEINVYLKPRNKEEIYLPREISSKLSFLNSNINIPFYEDFKKYLGIRKFDRKEIVDSLISEFNNVNYETQLNILNILYQFIKETKEKQKVEVFEKVICEKLPNYMGNNETINIKILNLIYSIYLKASDEEKKYLNISEYILIPAFSKNNKLKWINLKEEIIYFDDCRLLNLYWDKGRYFLNADYLSKKIQNFSLRKWKKFFKLLGIWDKPAFYRKATEFYSNNIFIRKRRDFIFNSGFSPYKTLGEIRNDIYLDEPTLINTKFTNFIINNWKFYKNNLNKSVQFVSKKYTYKDVSNFKVTEFYWWLRTSGWIFSYSKNGITFALPKEVIGISKDDFKSLSKVEHIKILPIDYRELKEFIDDFEIFHTDKKSIDNYKNILLRIYNSYKDLDSIDEKFIEFYKFILDYVAQYYDENPTIINELSEIYFLSKHNNNFSFKKGKDIYFIDDKFTYYKLPSEIKSLIPIFISRNNFKKVAKRIGKIFSEELKTKLIEPNNITEYKKFEISNSKFFRNLPELLAIVERYLEESLSDKDIKNLKKYKCIEVENIKVDIYIKNVNKHMEIERDYFIDKENFLVILKRNLDKNKNLYYEVLKKVFEEILNRNLEKIKDSFRVYFVDESYIEEENLFENIQKIKHKLNLLNVENEIKDSKHIANRSAAEFSNQKYKAILKENHSGDILESSKEDNLKFKDVNSEKSSKHRESSESLIQKVSFVEKSNNQREKLFQNKIKNQKSEKQKIEKEFSDEELNKILNNLPLTPKIEIVGVEYNKNTKENSPRNKVNRQTSKEETRNSKTDLSQKGKKQIGYIAESYIYRLLNERKTEFLDKLNIKQDDIEEIVWFNKDVERVINERKDISNFQDKSVGYGYDIEVILKNKESIYIEVKGQSEDSNEIFITKNEFNKFKEKEGRYYFIILRNIKSEKELTINIVNEKQVIEENIERLSIKLKN